MNILVSQVVKILDTVSVTETRQLFIVMELCEGGNLFQWIQRNRKHKMLNETVSSVSGVLRLSGTCDNMIDFSTNKVYTSNAGQEMCLD